MRRVKLGDVFSVKVPNGYKLVQWAYRIPRKGDFVRVFKGLYKSVPNNLQEIVESEHSYVISMEVSRYYRTGLSEFIGNFEIPEKYTFPKYQISFYGSGGIISKIKVMSSTLPCEVRKTFDVSCMKDLPEPYRCSNLFNGYFTPHIVLHLFNNGFDFDHLERYYYTGKDMQVYTEMVDAALARENAMKEERRKRKLCNTGDGTVCSDES